MNDTLKQTFSRTLADHRQTLRRGRTEILQVNVGKLCKQLGTQWKDGGPLFLWDIDPKRLEGRPIALGNHCFGCTAGCGSSCSGALV